MATEQARTRSTREGLTTALVLGLLVFGVLAWVFFAFHVIGERTPGWSYGAHEVTPAQSYSSTRPAPPAAQTPRQVELPPSPSGEKSK